MLKHNRIHRALPGAMRIGLAALLALWLTMPAAAQTRRIVVPRPTAAVAGPQGAAIRFDPAVTAAQLRALPRGTLITLRSGRTVSAERLAATHDALKAIAARQKQLRPMDLRMSRPVGAPQIQWAGPQQLAQVARMQANTVVRLPDGRLLTAGDINKLQVLATRTDIVRKLEARAHARAGNLRGTPALVVRSAADLRQVERLPDNAIVATADGKRATAGDIRKVMAARVSAPSALRQQGGVR